MLSKKMELALNKQINEELWSAYLYLSMSAHFAAAGKSGFAHWFKVQFEEEQEHASKLMEYIVDRNGKVKLEPIREVHTEWKSALHAFEETLAHEKVVTAFINDLVTLARSENDYATENMLQWFVSEQVEEEATAQSYIDALTMIGDNGFGIYTLDKELKGRSE